MKQPNSQLNSNLIGAVVSKLSLLKVPLALVLVGSFSLTANALTVKSCKTELEKVDIKLGAVINPETNEIEQITPSETREEFCKLATQTRRIDLNSCFERLIDIGAVTADEEATKVCRFLAGYEPAIAPGLDSCIERVVNHKSAEGRKYFYDVDSGYPDQNGNLIPFKKTALEVATRFCLNSKSTVECVFGKAHNAFMVTANRAKGTELEKDILDYFWLRELTLKEEQDSSGLRTTKQSIRLRDFPFMIPGVAVTFCRR